MAELKEFEVIMRCTPVAGMNGKGEIVIQAEKVSELVRCKDCIHRHQITCPFIISNAYKTSTDDDFCSRGEKRDDG